MKRLWLGLFLLGSFVFIERVNATEKNIRFFGSLDYYLVDDADKAFKDAMNEREDLTPGSSGDLKSENGFGAH